MSVYWLIDLILLLPPLLLSFHKKTYFVNKWKFVFPAIFIVYLFMMLWDYFFIAWTVWSFNPKYISELYIYEIPVEEHLFYWAVLLMSAFIYENATLVLKRDYLGKYSMAISIVLCLALAALYYSFYTKLYFGIACACSLFLVIQHIFVFRSHWRYMGIFYWVYFAMLLPMLLIYAVLTYLPVIIYNPNELMGYHIGSIPIENLLYYFFQFLAVITVYEFLKKKFTEAPEIPQPTEA